MPAQPNPARDGSTVVLTRDQRDALHRTAAWLLEAHFADMCQELDEIRPKAPAVRRLFDLFDEIGWALNDDRDSYAVHADQQLRDQLATLKRDTIKCMTKDGDHFDSQGMDQLLDDLNDYTAALAALEAV